VKSERLAFGGCNVSYAAACNDKRDAICLAGCRSSAKPCSVVRSGCARSFTVPAVAKPRVSDVPRKVLEVLLSERPRPDLVFPIADGLPDGFGHSWRTLARLLFAFSPVVAISELGDGRSPIELSGGQA
jgi:hypothetical protein